MGEGLAEEVLVVPREILEAVGMFQGFCSDVSRYLPALLDQCLIARFGHRSPPIQAPTPTGDGAGTIGWLGDPAQRPFQP